jgi:protein involved in polysaccharide export with SLBB domain/capsular polysaccharide biosynthesis protein
MNEINGAQPLPSPFGAWAVLDIWARRWRWIAACTVVTAIAGALVAQAVWSRSFSSTAQLIRYEPSSVDDSYHPRALAAPSLVVMLQAPGLLEEVGSHLQRPVSAKELAEHLEVTLDRNNDVVTVTANGRSPDEAIDTVNRYCAAAIAYTQKIQRQEAIDVGDNLNHQLEQVESEIASTRRAIPASGEPAADSLVSGADAAAEEPSGLTQTIQAARERLDDLVTRYTDAHPLVREQRARLAALVEEQRQTLPATASFPAARTRVATPAPISPLFYGRVTPEEVAMSERVRALETNRALLIERQRAIQPFRESPPGYFRVLLSAAASPTRLQRYRLEIVLFACLGAIVGLLGSAAQILAGEFLDNRIRTRTDVRRVTGLPLLATLGDLKSMSPVSQEQWAFRAWTALQGRLSTPPSHGMICGITSANGGDGRSTWIGLLSRAARSCGFRVLTIDAQPSQKLSADLAQLEKRPPPAALANGSQHAAALVTDDLSAPGQVVERLTSEECPPVVSIPLPGWVWNIERRKQWRSALEAWRAIHHVVILVDLPPALVAESVLLAETIPNLIWLVDRDKSDSTETLIDLETLRDASCNLVGAVFNRERAAPLSGQFSRWLGSGALMLLLCAWPAGPTAQGAAEPPQPAEGPAAFSLAGSPQRAAWQQRLTLGPGDVLSLHLFGSPELTRENVSVGPDGMISYLEAQDIDASGLTVDELRGRINAELGRYRRAPEAYVTPVSYRSKKYYMMGTVVQKGVFYLDHPTTVIEAVARARGFETGVSNGDTVDAADFSRSFLARGNHRVPVDFERLFLHGDLSQNVALEPNDYLYFPSSNSGQIYVLGAVDLPGPVAYDPNVSALSAIASRGGFTPRAWKTHVLVLRGSLDHPVAFKVDVAGALTGDSPNLALRPGDLVYVSDRPWIRAEELLDHAASAFVESAVVTWTGLNVGPSIISRPKP